MTYDVIVVGAGPGGIAAATVAAEAGKHVCMLDDNLSPGGQIWRGLRTDSVRKFPHGGEFTQWINRLRSTNCEVLSGWRATDRTAPGVLRLEREGESRDIAFRKLILATGARERFLPFPGWTLPGVTGAGGLQALVKSGLDVSGHRIVVAGTGPLLLAIAAGLADAGATIVGIYEQAPLSRLIRFGLTLAAHPDKLAEGARYRRKLRGVAYRTNSWIVRAEGCDRVEHVAITDGRKQWSHDCEWLACGFHLVPNLELPHLLGCEIKGGYVSVDLLQQSSVSGLACVGELTGIGGLEKALLEGQLAGLAAAGCESEARSLASHIEPLRRFGQRLDIAFALRDELRVLPEPETIVCRCEDVPYGELRECRTLREAKLHTRCGMGACQGRICGTATHFLFGWKQAGARPPVYPAAVSVVSAKAGTADSRIN
jgi:D-hydroxyproline dehydrogenase subunit alpha